MIKFGDYQISYNAIAWLVVIAILCFAFEIVRAYFLIYLAIPLGVGFLVVVGKNLGQ